MKKHPYRGQFEGVGPKTIEDLELIGIENREQLAELGAEGAMKLLMMLSGGRQKGMCSCQAYTFEGIITNTMWYKIPDARKKELIAATKRIRKEFE